MTQHPGVSVGFPERIVAYIIDAIIIAISTVILIMLLPVALAYVIALVIGVGYAVYFWTTSGQTPGKMAMGLKVVNAETGGLLDPGAAVIRYVGYLISGIPLYLGFLWIIWDPKHEGWHDKIAKTKVIRAK